MLTTTLYRRRTLPPVLIAVAGLAAAGCGQGLMGQSGRTSNLHGRAVLMDGRFDDWSASKASVSDEHFLYFRVTVEDHGMPLQAAPETVALWLDLDSDAATGIAPSSATVARGLPDFGPEIIVEFSPPGRPGELRRGVAVYAAGDGGERVELGHAQVDLISTPTYAAGAYEIRLSRRVDPEVPEGVRRALAMRGSARSMFIVSNAQGTIDGWSDPETFTLVSAAEGEARTTISLPAREAGTVRVLSWNVHDRSPLNAPAPFARIIQALDPDVILFQEMWDTDEATMLAWFTSVVTGETEWNARTPEGGRGGIMIVSRYPLSALGPDLLSLPQDAGGQAVRFIGALAETPAGTVAVANVHLKCCGTAGSSEDQRRLAEARTINLELSRALAEVEAPMRLIAGDFNLVGSRTPLDVLRADLDTGGGQLAVVESMVLGDAAAYTWFDAASEFGPGRLDWAVAGTAGAEVVRAFVLDGRRLSERSLTAMGLDRADTGASDHLPLVVDLRPR